MTDARDLALPTGYRSCWSSSRTGSGQHARRHCGPSNTQLIELYWSIGRTILERQEAEGWGSGVMGRLADDLRAEFPEMKGLSRRTAGRGTSC